jgi:hypothetical protein
MAMNDLELGKLYRVKWKHTIPYDERNKTFMMDLGNDDIMLFLGKKQYELLFLYEDRIISWALPKPALYLEDVSDWWELV